MNQGHMITGRVVVCAVCSKREMLDESLKTATEQAEELGWGLTKGAGWVCASCLNNSEPLRNLLSKPERIVKDQPISE